MATAQFEVQMAHSVTEIGREKWDYLGTRCPFGSFQWYQFGETVLMKSSPIHIFLSIGHEPVARATFWLTSDEPLPIVTGIARSLMETAFRRWPLLLCRAPLVSESGLFLPEDGQLRIEALAEITRIVQVYSQKMKSSFVIFDYVNQLEATINGLLSFTVPDPGTWLKIEWESFEEYVKQLSASVRKDYHRHTNRAADLGVKVRRYATVTDVDHALQLIRQVELHHNDPRDPHVKQALDNLDMVNATWLVAEIDNRMVGCGLIVGDGSTFTLKFLGLDYDVKFVYFQLVYEAIRCAIDSGAHILKGGSGAYEFKQRLGFQLESNNQVAFAATNRFWRQIVHYMGLG